MALVNVSPFNGYNSCGSPHSKDAIERQNGVRRCECCSDSASFTRYRRRFYLLPDFLNRPIMKVDFPLTYQDLFNEREVEIDPVSLDSVRVVSSTQNGVVYVANRRVV